VVHLNRIQVKFEGQGHGSKFRRTRWNWAMQSID